MHLLFSLLDEKNQAIPVQKRKRRRVFNCTGNWRKNEQKRNYNGGIEIVYRHPPSQRIQKLFTDWIQIAPLKTKMLLSLGQKYSGCACSPGVHRNVCGEYYPKQQFSRGGLSRQDYSPPMVQSLKSLLLWKVQQHVLVRISIFCPCWAVWDRLEVAPKQPRWRRQLFPIGTTPCWFAAEKPWNCTCFRITYHIAVCCIYLG